MLIRRITTIQKFSGRHIRQGLSRKYIKEISCNLKGMMPKRRKNERMNEESANHVVNGTNFIFCFAILRRSMWARELKKKTIVFTKSMKQRIVILTPVIILKTFKFLRKLCLNLISERWELFKNLRFCN